VVNNVIVSDNDYALVADDAVALADLYDYNLYFSNGFGTGSDILDIDGSLYPDVAAWQAALPSQNANSVFGDPVFIDPLADLHLVGVAANDNGDNSLGILVDIDGDTRPLVPSTTVDIGADEFTPISDDAELLALLVDQGCGDSTTTVDLVFRNLGQNPITSLNANAAITGDITATLNGTYSGNLLSLEVDTFNLGSINTYAGANAVDISAALSLAGDQNPGNDSLALTGLRYVPFAPVGFDNSLCFDADTAQLVAAPVSGVKYQWFATANALDTVPISTDDTLKVATPLSQNTYYLAYAGSVDSLATSFGGGNGQNGNAFDILPSTNLDITGLDLNLDASGAVDVEVYFRNGTHVGNEASLAGWTLHESATLTAQGAGVPTFMPFTNSFNALVGNTYGVLVAITSATGQMDYTNGTAVGNVLAQNNDLTIFEGAGISWPLASVFTPRFWNGRIYYEADACSDIRTPLSLTLATDSAEASFTLSGTQPTFNFDASASLNADVYQWDFGDGNTGTGQTTSHTYANNGMYTVVLTTIDTTDCASEDTATAMIDVNVGLIENALSGSLQVFPNPSRGLFRVEFDQQGSAKAVMRLQDVQGRSLSQIELESNGAQFRTELNLSDYPAGVYLLELESGGLKAQRRLIKN
jgi:PKD repeat protein